MAGLDSSTVSLLHFDDDVKNFDEVSSNQWGGAGNVTLDPINKKFGSGSLYLNGGAYICAPYTGGSVDDISTGDFTIEWWEYRTSNGLYPTVFNSGTTPYAGLQVGYGSSCQCYASTTNGGFDVLNEFSLGTTDLNTWNHFSLVRNGNTFYGFKNGKLTNTKTSSAKIAAPTPNSYYIGGAVMSGHDFYGYIDEFRISNVARYTTNFTPQISRFEVEANTVSLLHMEPCTFKDEKGLAWTPVGLPQISSSQSKFGGKSLCLDGSSCLTTPSKSDFNFGANDFTIDWWEYRTSSYDYATVFDLCYGDGHGICAFQYRGNVVIMIGSNASSWDIASFVSMGTVDMNIWNHFAVTRSGSEFYLIKNGVVTQTLTSSLPIGFNDSSIVIGDYRWNQTVSFNFPGYIDEFRVSKGIARWTSNFTPPTRAYSFGGALFKKDSTFYGLNSDKTLNGLGTPATRDDMITLFKNNAIPQSIDSATANTMKENNLKLAVWDADVDSNYDTTVKATPTKTQFVQEANDISLKEASYIDWIKINDTIVESTGSGAIKHLVSRDSGKTWYAYDSVGAAWNLIIDTTNAADGSFDTIDTKRFVPSDTALTKIMNNGMTSTVVAAAPFQAWTIDGGYKQIRFAHMLQISSTVDTAFMDNIKYQYDGTGTWDLGANKVDYKVSTNNNTHKLTWITGGKRVKVNY